MKKKVLILLGIMMLFLVSCGKHPVEKDVENTLKLLQTGDMEKISKETGGLFSSKTSPEMVEALSQGFKKITYKINKTTVNSDEVIVNITMKAPDLGGLSSEVSKKMVASFQKMKGKSKDEITAESEKMMAELIKERIASDKSNEKTIDVVYKKVDGAWSVDLNRSREFLNMMTLNMMGI